MFVLFGGLGIVLNSGANERKITLSDSPLEWQYLPFGMRTKPDLELNGIS